MKTVAITLMAAVLALGTLATVGAKQPEGINVGSNLSPKLRGLLIQEMQEIEKASQQIHAAIVQGHHEIVAQKAQEIHDSFIMDQQMTEADTEALLAAVPKAFLVLDEELHELSAELAKAGRERDSARQLERFAEMSKGCVGCHSVYATARFPGLHGDSP